MLLYHSKFLLVNYLEIQYLLHIKFLPATKEIDSIELKAEFMLFIDKMVKRRARHILIDTENIEHICSSDFILWFDKIILPMLKSIKADKIAWLFRNNLQEKISTDKIIYDKIDQRIFIDSKNAMNWLLENKDRKPLSFENGKKPPSHHHHH